MPSEKQLQLIQFYQQMAEHGVNRGPCEDGAGDIPSSYSLMNIRLFKEAVKPLFEMMQVRSVLDYGSGLTNWEAPGFHEQQSAMQYFELNSVNLYEPSIGLFELVPSDAVVCFDVLEHIFLADISSVIWDLFSCASKLLVVNVACYPARSLLPNGENAHVTVRPPLWWKGAFDMIASAFPDVTYRVYASTEYGKAVQFSDCSMKLALQAEGFTRERL